MAPCSDVRRTSKPTVGGESGAWGGDRLDAAAEQTAARQRNMAREELAPLPRHLKASDVWPGPAFSLAVNRLPIIVRFLFSGRAASGVGCLTPDSFRDRSGSEAEVFDTTAALLSTGASSLMDE